jgi:2'-hydroxyisoflavone reductase
VRSSDAGCAAALGVTATPVWADADFLAGHGVAAWTELPLWAGTEGRGVNAVSNRRALAAGLSLRALELTVRDTAQWAGVAPLPAGIGLAPERERLLLQAWAERACGQGEAPLFLGVDL